MIMVPIIFTVLEKVQPCSIKINSAHKINSRSSQTALAKKAFCHFKGGSEAAATNGTQRGLHRNTMPVLEKPQPALLLSRENKLIQDESRT
ncbi:hypothetical protein DUD43_04650 [Alcaligenes faecalis]|nr:hypothetical protein DUD43_04650 [Alcaligenes faecalis]